MTVTYAGKPEERLCTQNIVHDVAGGYGPTTWPGSGARIFAEVFRKDQAHIPKASIVTKHATGGAYHCWSNTCTKYLHQYKKGRIKYTKQTSQSNLHFQKSRPNSVLPQDNDILVE